MSGTSRTEGMLVGVLSESLYEQWMVIDLIRSTVHVNRHRRARLLLKYTSEPHGIVCTNGAMMGDV